MSKKNWTHWFEIPVSNFDRAKSFYETIFDTEIEANDLGSIKMGIFPHEEVGGAIVKGEYYTPTPDGSIIYLNADPDLSGVLGKIEDAGGKVIQQKKQISPDHGYMALFEDSEGNRLALHSNS